MTLGFNKAFVALTLCHDKHCHVALAAIEIRNVLQEAVELHATDSGHMTFMQFWRTQKKREKVKQEECCLLINLWLFHFNVTAQTERNPLKPPTEQP